MKTILVLTLLILSLPLVCSADDTQRKSLKKGAVLTSSNNQPVLVCRSRDKCKDYTNAVQLGREGQIKTMKKNNDNFLVPAGTQVKVINYDPEYCKVRVATGKYKHKTGWVATSLLKAAEGSDKK